MNPKNPPQTTRRIAATSLVAALTLMALASCGQQPPQTTITLQLKWLHQAQFAGYYVAQDKGWYADEGLDVDIQAGGPGIHAIDLLANGQADVAIEWLPAALQMLHQNKQLVNIAQPYQHPGMQLVCRNDARVSSPQDLMGKRIGHWPGDEGTLLLKVLMTKLDGLPAAARSAPLTMLEFHSPDGMIDAVVADSGSAPLTMLEFDDVVEAIKNRQTDCILALSYNEAELSMADLRDEVTVFSLQDDFGIRLLEDGIYVHQDLLQDDDSLQALRGFVCASMKGWQWARQHQDEAVDIVLKYTDSQDEQTRLHQTRMLREVARLTAGADTATDQPQQQALSGALSLRDYERAVDAMVAAGLLEATPDGYRDGWTDEITSAQCANR